VTAADEIERSDKTAVTAAIAKAAFYPTLAITEELQQQVQDFDGFCGVARMHDKAPDITAPDRGEAPPTYHLPGRATLHQLDAPRDSPSNPLPRLWRHLQPLSIDKMPLEVSPPRTSHFGSPMVLSRVHWVRPELVTEVKFFTWTDDNLLRQVVYEGLREDKPAAAVRRPTRNPPRRRALPFARGGRAAEVPGVTGPPSAANVSDVACVW